MQHLDRQVIEHTQQNRQCAESAHHVVALVMAAGYSRRYGDAMSALRALPVQRYLERS